MRGAARMYNLLTNDDLIHSYLNAVQMQLDQDFINMLITEIEKRKLPLDWEQPFTANTPLRPNYSLAEESRCDKEDKL
ncbi:MAG: Sporulation inhibitor [Paenibacillus sp.]|jgi:hypothetical protein|nr:Sporulation inhibitor [Paenibacillus sp.]